MIFFFFRQCQDENCRIRRNLRDYPNTSPQKAVVIHIHCVYFYIVLAKGNVGKLYRMSQRYHFISGQCAPGEVHSMFFHVFSWIQFLTALANESLVSVSQVKSEGKVKEKRRISQIRHRLYIRRITGPRSTRIKSNHCRLPKYNNEQTIQHKPHCEHFIFAFRFSSTFEFEPTKLPFCTVQCDGYHNGTIEQNENLVAGKLSG